MNSAFFYIMRAVEEAAVFNGAEGAAIIISICYSPSGGQDAANY